MHPTGSEQPLIITSAQLLMGLGGILLLGLATDMLGRRTFLPRVTLLLAFGILLGGEGLDLIPEIVSGQFELIAEIALVMIGFLLGGKLTPKSLEANKGEILWISIFAAVGACLLVTLLLIAIGLPLEAAIILGCIAAATDPVATVETTLESGSSGSRPRLLLAIVALDDAWALIIFSLGLAVVSVIGGMDGVAGPIMQALRDMGGALLLGLFIGLPAAYLTGRIRPGRPMLTEALGLVLLCTGAALWLEVSFLIASMVMGAVIANLARHHEYPFHAIEDIEWPFMVLFFVLAGAQLQLISLAGIGLIGLVYVVFRALGKILGAYAGSRMAGSDPLTKRWMGMALLPQAGAAMGMALVASSQFPEYRQVLLTVAIGSTVFFELVGPLFTQLALRRMQQP